MNVGMLWLDDDKRSTLEDKVRRAADYYQHKYGRKPNLCYVNKRALGEEKKVGSIEVLPLANVLPHHLWMGVRAS